MPGEPAVGGVVCGGVQVGALGFQPGGSLRKGGQVRGLRRRVTGQRVAVGVGPGGEVPAGGHGGVQVVVQQSADRGIRFGGVLTGGQGAGVLAEQVVQLVAAGGGLGEQVVVIQVIELAAGSIEGGGVQGSSGVGVDARAGDQAEAAEQPLLARVEVLVGQVE